MSTAPRSSGSGDACFSPEQLLAHAPFVRALARALVRDDAAADDLAQASMLAALQHPPRRGSVRAWLVGVVRNLARQTRRGDERRLAREAALAFEVLPAAATPHEAAERLELFGRLVAAVQRLDEPCRATIVRRFFDGATAQEIANEQGIPAETVRTRIKRGLERLRSDLDALSGGRAAWSALLAPWVALPVRAAATATKLLIAAAALIVTTTVVLWPAPHGDNTLPAAATSRIASNDPVAPPSAAPATSADATLAPTRNSDSPAAPPSDPLATWIVRGRVRADVRTARPHVRIHAKLWDGLEPQGDPRLDLHLGSDELGHFEWPLRPPPGAVALWLSADEPNSYQYGDERFIAAGAAPPQDFDLRCVALDAAVTGVVFGPDGAPAPDAQVTVMQQTVDCDERGEFTAPAPAAGTGSGEVQVVGWAPGCAEGMVVARLGPLGAPAHVELHLAPGFSVRGRITDAAGAPISGATVTTFGMRATKATSDAQGDYCLEHVAARDPTIALDARAAGYAQSTGEVSSRGSDARLDFVMKRGVTLRGTVVAPDGKPAAGAAITLGFSPFAYDKLATHSRDDGSFKITGARPSRANLYFFVDWPGAAPLVQPTTVPTDVPDGSEVADLVLKLGAGHFAAGRVKDERGRPVPSIYVMIQKEHQADDSYSSGQTDATGAFRVERLPDGPLVLRAYGDGFGETRLEGIGVDRADLEVTLKRAGRAVGRVVDGVTGAPLTHFKIRFCRAKLERGENSASFYSSDWSESGHTFDDAQGRFSAGETESMPPGAILGLEASAEGYSPGVADHVVLRAEPDPDELVIRLFRGGALEGLVVDASDGRPVGGALVKLVNDQLPFDANHDSYANARPTAKSDDAGRFRLDRVPVGTTSLVVDHADYARAFEDDFEIPRGGTAPARTIRLERGGAIDGVALDHAGRPLAGASITLYGESKARIVSVDGTLGAAARRALERVVSMETTSDTAGHFSFTHLPAGRVHVGRNEMVARDGQPGALRLRAIELTAVVEAGVTHEVRLGPTGSATLRGRVHGDSDLPKEFTVRLASEARPPATWPDLVFEIQARDGVFEFVGVPAGKYRVVVYGAAPSGGGRWSGFLDINVAEGSALEVTVEVARTR
jgi:RNA polymerase sigma-70 factor (ECF subfamily)